MHRAPVKILVFVLLLVSLGAFLMGAAPFPLADQNILSWSVWVFLAICLNMGLQQNLMRLATFALAVIWSYALLGNLIPQGSSGPAVAVGDIERTPEAFVAAGSRSSTARASAPPATSSGPQRLRRAVRT